jgi:hypothetical protein
MIVRTLRRFWNRLRRTISNEPRDGEFLAEMEQHVASLAERYRCQGMTSKQAELAARRQFGNTVLLEEDRRSMLTIPTLDEMRGDLIFAARMLRKNPGFTGAAVLTLALGIGANTAIFSLCNAVLFQALPYSDPDRVVMLWEQMRDGKTITVAPANFVDWRNASRSFSDMAAVNPNSGFTLGSRNEPVRLTGAGASASFFPLLGIRFAIGRSFLPEEDRPGQNRVAILSHRVWQQRFRSRPRDHRKDHHAQRCHLQRSGSAAGRLFNSPRMPRISRRGARSMFGCRSPWTWKNSSAGCIRSVWLRG